MLEGIFVVCAALGGYSVVQKVVISPFRYLFSGSAAQIIDSKPQVTVVPYPSQQLSPSNAPTISNQNSNGLFAHNSTGGIDQPQRLPFSVTYLIVAAGTGYLIKNNIASGSLVLHNPTSWSRWALRLTPEQEKDLATALQQEIAARYPDCDGMAIQERIHNDLLYEYRSLLWFKRIGTLVNNLCLSWLFEIEPQDLVVAQQVVIKLELIRKQFELFDPSIHQSTLSAPAVAHK